MISIKKILDVISEDECVVLENHIGQCVVDCDDRVEETDEGEVIYIQTSLDNSFPVPNDFTKVTIMSKSEFAFERMMEMMGESTH